MTPEEQAAFDDLQGKLAKANAALVTMTASRDTFKRGFETQSAAHNFANQRVKDLMAGVRPDDLKTKPLETLPDPAAPIPDGPIGPT